MRWPSVEAHDGNMFIAYPIAKLLVAEHQRRLREDARPRAATRRPTRLTTSDRPTD
jgi:hypothetical protein